MFCYKLKTYYNLPMKYKFKAFVAPFLLLAVFTVLWSILAIFSSTNCGISYCSNNVPILNVNDFLSKFLHPLFIPSVFAMLTAIGFYLGIKVSILKRKFRKTSNERYLIRAEKVIILINSNFRVLFIFIMILILFTLLSNIKRPNLKTNQGVNGCMPGTIIGYNQDTSPIYCE